MLSFEESLKILKETKALLEGHFILSSGLHSPKYVQCAQLMSKPDKAKKICESLAEKISNEFENFDVILSPAMGGIIIGYEIGRLLKKETIFPFIEDFPLDLLIKHAYPTIFALLSKTNFEHSKLDFPVVITSSTIKTFWSFFIKKSLLSLNSPLTLSEKIVSLFNNLPIS